MPFTLPALPYAYDALEPHIDARTMEIHHTKHHQTYVNNLNAALEKAPQLEGKSLDDLMRGISSVAEAVRTAVRNNGGGHWNHSMFWELMGPQKGGEPKGRIGDAIKSSFGDVTKFKEQFTAAGTGRFGSGWAWLIDEGNGKLSITSTPNQDNPLMEGRAEKSEPKKPAEKSAAELDGRARAARPISLFVRSSRLAVLGSLFSSSPFSARPFRLALLPCPYGTTLLFGSSLTTHNPELTSFTYAMSFLTTAPHAIGALGSFPSGAPV